MKEKKERLCRKCKKPLPSDTPWYAHVCDDCKNASASTVSTKPVLKSKRSSKKPILKESIPYPFVSKGATGFGINVVKIFPRMIGGVS